MWLVDDARTILTIFIISCTMITMQLLGMCQVFHTYIPSPNQQKKNSAKRWGNDNENYDENYNENTVKTVSKYLACIKVCWGPEFEPSVEEIVDYWWDMVIPSVHFLWRAHTQGDFPIQSSTWQVEVTSRSISSSYVPQYTRIQSMRSLSMCPSLNYGSVILFHEGQGT